MYTPENIKRLIPVIFLTFVNVLAFTIVFPIFPFVVEKYGGSAVMYGILISTYSLFQFFGSPVMGSLSDKYGRRSILIISQIGTFIGWLVFGVAYFVPNIRLFAIPLPIIIIFISRIIDGVTGGNISVANAYVADITKPEERTQVYGLLGAVFGAGFLVGPTLGGFSYSFLNLEYLGTMIFSATVSLLALLIMYKFLPESLPTTSRNNQLQMNILSQINIFERIQKFRKNKYLSNLLFIRIFLVFSFSCYASIAAIYLRDTFGVNSSTLGMLFFIIGLFLIINQTIATKRFASRFGEIKTFYIGQGIIWFGLLLLVLVSTIPQFLIVAYIVNLGLSLSFITFKALITNAVDQASVGEITGLDDSILAAGQATAPIFAGVIYTQLTHLSFIIFGLIILLPHLLLGIMGRYKSGLGMSIRDF